MTHATQTTAQEERNINMYGIADIDAYVESVKESITYQFTGANMVVAGLMSDAQELIAGGAQDRSRQTFYFWSWMANWSAQLIVNQPKGRKPLQRITYV
jgi:hypothetical protein